MTFVECIESQKGILMEGALGERLKREYHLKLDTYVDMAGFVYSEAGRIALRRLWNEYAEIAKTYKLPFLATRERFGNVCWRSYGMQRGCIYRRWMSFHTGCP